MRLVVTTFFAATSLIWRCQAIEEDFSKEDIAFWSRALNGVAYSYPPTPPPTSPPSVHNVTVTMERNYFSVQSKPLDYSGVASSSTLFVPIWEGDIEDAPNDVVCFVGEGYDLEANITSYLLGGPDCTAENGCGVHIHDGFDCNSTETQGEQAY
jgi:hypothetical protein